MSWAVQIGSTILLPSDKSPGDGRDSLTIGANIPDVFSAYGLEAAFVWDRDDWDPNSAAAQIRQYALGAGNGQFFILANITTGIGVGRVETCKPVFYTFPFPNGGQIQYALPGINTTPEWRYGTFNGATDGDGIVYIATSEVPLNVQFGRHVVPFQNAIHANSDLQYGGYDAPNNRLVFFLVRRDTATVALNTAVFFDWAYKIR